MKISQLAKSVPGLVQIIGPEETQVTNLCTDSRKVESGALFFCTPGTKQDAHAFAPQAVASGAVALVVDHKLDIAGVCQVVVEDVRAALSYMAAAFQGHPADKVHLMGITGTKGKTTCAFLVKSILEAAGHKVGLIGTVCSMIGAKQIPSNLTTPDPLDFQSLLREMVDAGVTHVVMEVSAHAMALRKLEGMRFDVCGFSNFSQDHLDFFGTMENYLKAKMQLFTRDKCSFAVYNADDMVVAEAMRDVDVPKLSFGIAARADMYVKDTEVKERGRCFKIVRNKKYAIDVDLKLSGLFNTYNSLMAAAMCSVIGVGPNEIQRGLDAVTNVPGRVELLETGTPYKVMLDYAHSPDALSNILKTVRETAKKRVIALFGCGGDRDHEKRPIMGEIAGRLADYCILTSDNPRSEEPGKILEEIEAGIKKTDCAYTVIENRRAAIKYALEMGEAGDVIVLAGKGHETYQEIKGVKYPFDEKIVVEELLEE